MPNSRGENIAARAISQIGTPFRLRGRTPGVALDCVGLVAYALEVKNPPIGYSLKGTKLSDIKSYLEYYDLRSTCKAAMILPGDILLVLCAEIQFHLMIAVQGGWAHSHAGLQKVVCTPGACPWPIIASWRVKEI